MKGTYLASQVRFSLTLFITKYRAVPRFGVCGLNSYVTTLKRKLLSSSEKLFVTSLLSSIQVVLNSDHSNEIYCAVFHAGPKWFETPSSAMRPSIKWELLEGQFIMKKLVLPLEYGDEICGHSKGGY